MKRVLVFGSNGMLGHQVVKTLEAAGDIEVRGLGREDFAAGVDSHKSLGSMYPNFDYVINCLGVIRPDDNNPAPAIIANALFPHDLVKYMAPAKVIHISTDCVFSGKHGGCNEAYDHDGTSRYAKSKSLGEPREAMVLRTSIVGEEPSNTMRSLVSWAKAMEGQEVEGYADHLWNGMTAKTLAVVLHRIIERELWSAGVSHIFSDTITKGELLRLIDNRYGLSLRIKHVAWGKRDMTLSTGRELMYFLDCIPPIAQQIAEL